MFAKKYLNFFNINELAESISEYLPDFDREKFLEAFEFAAEAHEGQFRKDGSTPYIAHPVAATEILASIHSDQDTLISCLLHDVPEDTERTIEDVRERFGDSVAYLVEGITKLSKVQYQHNMRERDVESLRKLLMHSAKDLRILLIKLADRLHNMQTLDNIKKSEKRLRIATETLEIYVPIANLLGIREFKYKLEDYCFKYMFPTEYVNLKETIKSSRESRIKNFKQLEKILKDVAAEAGVEVSIEKKRKNLFSIFKRLSEKGEGLSSVDARVGVKLVVNSIADCYKLLGAIHLRFPPLTSRFKDYIANTKSNGYRSLHTTVFGVNGILTEMQIRTQEMELDAEYGIMATFFQKQKDKSSDAKELFANDVRKSQWLKKLSDLSDGSDSSSSFIEQLKLDVLEERIVILTPKGKPIDLPKGSTVLDFAYALDPKIANHAESAIINKQRRPISTVLRTRDVVEIVAKREVKPELAWLSFVKTLHAQKEITKSLRKSNKQKKIVEGRKHLQREFDILNLGLVVYSFGRIKKKVSEDYGIKLNKIEDLYIAIGQGDLTSGQVIAALRGHERVKTEEKQRVYIKILAKNRLRLMADVYEVLYRYVDDMYYFKGWAGKHELNATFISEVLVSSTKISKLFEEIRQIESVEEVHKSTVSMIAMLTSLSLLMLFGWLMHPFILIGIAETILSWKHPELLSLSVYLGIFLLFAVMVYLVRMVTKFFPILRRQKRFWIAAFTLPLMIYIVLWFEVMYFGLKLNWIVVSMEILLVYLYLGFSFKKKT